MNIYEQILEELKQKNGFSDLQKKEYTDEEWKQAQVDAYNDLKGDLTGFECSICKNKGYVAKLVNGEYTQRECDCMVKRRVLAMAKKSGLGDVLSKCKFKDYIATEKWQEEIKQKAMEFCQNDEAKWFYIGGQVGCGKTMICTAICGHYIKQGQEVKYMLWAEESKRIKAIVNEYKEYNEAMQELYKVPVLYIDDFLKTKAGEQPTQADINLAFEILNHRLMQNDLITIISSEKTLNNILEYDEATMSRIYVATGKYKINIEKDINKNYRLRS